MGRLKITELSETEELYLLQRAPVSSRFLEKLGWSGEYCVKVTLDEKNSRLVITQSAVKAKENTEPDLKEYYFYIVQEYEAGKRFAKIAYELNIDWRRA